MHSSKTHRRQGVQSRTTNIADKILPRSRRRLGQAAGSVIEAMEKRVMLTTALNPADYASLGTFQPAAGTYTVDTTAATINGPGVSVTGSVVNNIAVFDFSSVAIGSGVTINAAGANPWAILSKGGISVAGTIHNDGTTSEDGDSHSNQSATPGGPGGGSGGAPNQPGTGPSFGSPATGGGPDSGAGGGGFGGAGAIGANDNLSDGSTPGNGGLANAVTNNPLIGGSGGGGSSHDAAGGAGGGAIELSATTFLDIATDGTVTANGGSGALGFEGASGGGSGGGILLAAPTINVAGALSANGGQGGDGGVDGDGGGGGGGEIVVLSSRYTSSGSISVSGGSGVYTSEGFPHNGPTTVAGSDGVITTPPGMNGATVALVYAAPSDGNAHDLLLELDPTGQNVEIIDKSDGQILDSLPLFELNSVQITGGANEENSLTVDYVNGFIGLPISYDGGSGTGSHMLSVIESTPSANGVATPAVTSVSNGITTSDVYTPGAALGAGSLAITENQQMAQAGSSTPATIPVVILDGGASTISFVNLTPVLDTVPGTLTVAGTNANDTITYGAGIIDPVNDGLVAVNNLETIEFSNKTGLTINTGLGIDTVIDDVANFPTGMTSDVQVNAGDPNAGDTLTYRIRDGAQVTVSATDQGVGLIADAPTQYPDDVNYNGFANINLVGKNYVGDSIDVEGENYTFNDYVVAPSTVVGSGEITGTLDAVNIFNMSPAQYTIPNITYSGLAPSTSSSPPFAAISFDTQNGIFTGAGIGYEGQPTGGTFINVNGGTLTDSYNDGGIDPYTSVYNGAFFALYQINAQPNVAISVTENDTIPVYVKGKGLGSADTLSVTGDGTDSMNLDLDDSTIDGGLFSGIYYSGISSLTVNANGQALEVDGTAGTGNVSVTPTGSSAATFSLGSGFPSIYGVDISSLLVDPSGTPDSVTINATNASDAILATGNGAGNNVSVRVNSLLAVRIAEADTAMVDINGGTGDNTLTVDSTNGAFVIPITYNGGPGNNNALALQGGTATSDTYVAGPLPGAGSDTMVISGATQLVEFNLAPVTDSVAGPLTVNGTGGNDTIGYSQGPTNQGEVSVNSFEPIDFTNKTTLTLNGGNGNDQFTLDNLNSPPTGLTSINVNGGGGIDSLLVNAYSNIINVAATGMLGVNGFPPINYTSIESITIINALDYINVTPASTITANEGHALSNIPLGTFTGGPIGAVAKDFVASINWGDGHTSTGTVTGSAGSFAITGSHTYAEEGHYSPVVTVTDAKTIGFLTVGGVPITAYYTGPLSTPIDDSATIADPNVIASAITSPVVTISTGASTGTIKLATFTDPGGPESLGDYSASINWGDGHTSTGTISLSGSTFTVTSTGHTYTTAGTYSPVITIGHEATTPQVVTDTNRVVVVTPTTIHGTAATFTGHEGRLTSNGTVASFTSVNTTAPTSSFSAVINWGDGSANSTGTIVKDSAGHFHVTGTHMYDEEVTYPITVTIKQVGGSTITVNSKAVISPSPLDTLKGVSTLYEPLAEANFVNVCLGTFRDQSSTERDPGTYTGTVNWGDGHTTTAKFVYVSSTYNVGSYWKIEGSHKYTAKGTFTVTLTFHDLGGPSTNSVITDKVSIQ